MSLTGRVRTLVAMASGVAGVALAACFFPDVTGIGAADAGDGGVDAPVDAVIPECDGACGAAPGFARSCSPRAGRRRAPKTR